MVEPKVAVQVQAATQQCIFQVFGFGTDLDDSAGSFEIGGALTRYRPDAKGLGPYFEPGTLDLEHEFFLAIGPHPQ